MPKRNISQHSDEEDDPRLSIDGSESPERPLQTARKTGKKPNLKRRVEQTSEDEALNEMLRPIVRSSTATKPPAKKSKVSASSTSKGDKTHEMKIGVNESGERYVELGKKRRATVRPFKGSTLLDIREFYGDEGDLKPSKKGISLSQEQWESLKQSIDVIDSFFAKVNK